MKSISVLLQRILVLLPLLFISLQVQADEHDKEDVEKISVIGSHIKRTDMEGPSPVLVSLIVNKLNCPAVILWQ